MYINFDVKNTLIIIVAGLNLVYGVLIYLRNKKNSTSITFLFLTLAVGFWGLSIFTFRSAVDVSNAIVFSQVLYFSAALIPIVFLYFVYVFPDDKHVFKSWQKYLLPIPFFIIAILSLSPDLLIKDVIFVAGHENKIIFDQGLHTLYAIYVVSYFSYGYILLLKKYLEKTDKILRTQIIFIIIGTLLSTLVALVTNLIGPYLGYFEFNWFGQVGVIIMISTISYSIFKHQLFNIKLILVEISLILFNLLLFVNAVFSGGSSEFFASWFIFVGILLFSIFLLRSIYKDIHDREQIEMLAFDMDVVNRRLQAMEQSKTEFVSIASHQLRTPLTVIKGYASMILEGTFGVISSEARDAMEKLSKSNEKVVGLVEELLTVSRLEQGRVTLEFKTINLVDFVNKILLEAGDEVKKIGIDVSVTSEGGKSFFASVDEKKLKQVMLHLIDNALKYTKAPGSIRIALSVNNSTQKVRIAISDTGIGMTDKQINNITEKFDLHIAGDTKGILVSTKKKDSNDTEHKAGGIGLYISKEIIHAHNGGLRIESSGLGNGTTVVVELPAGELGTH